MAGLTCFPKGRDRKKKKERKKIQPPPYHCDIAYMCHPSGCASVLSFGRDGSQPFLATARCHIRRSKSMGVSHMLECALDGPTTFFKKNLIYANI